LNEKPQLEGLEAFLVLKLGSKYFEVPPINSDGSGRDYLANGSKIRLEIISLIK
jgi:hypothetical protein